MTDANEAARNDQDAYARSQERDDTVIALRAEVLNLKGVARHHKERAETFCAENARLTARVRELEGALGFYANPANRRDGRFEHQVDPDNGHNVLVSIPSSYIKDGGQRASAALRAEVETLREMQRNVLVEQGEEVSRLRAENERLRAALEKLSCKCPSNCDWEKHGDICPSWVARAALEGKP